MELLKGEECWEEEAALVALCPSATASGYSFLLLSSRLLLSCLPCTVTLLRTESYSKILSREVGEYIFRRVLYELSVHRSVQAICDNGANFRPVGKLLAIGAGAGAGMAATAAASSNADTLAFAPTISSYAYKGVKKASEGFLQNKVYSEATSVSFTLFPISDPTFYLPVI